MSVHVYGCSLSVTAYTAFGKTNEQPIQLLTFVKVQKIINVFQQRG